VIATTFKKVLFFTKLGQKTMGMPADRVEGVELVTDYGALDRAMAKKAKMEEKEAAPKQQYTPAYTEYWEGA